MKTVLYLGIVILHLAIWLGAFAMFEQGTREFSGYGEFNNLQEAYAFQDSVIKEALAVGGEVVKADISVKSPPTFAYRVILQSDDDSVLDSIRLLSDVKNHQFKYGVRSNSVVGVWVGFSIIGMVVIGFIMLYAYSFFKDSKGQSLKQMRDGK